MADFSGSREQPVLDSSELDLKKKRLLETLESALAPKDAVDNTVTAPPIPLRPSSLTLGIEVIDETALLDSVIKNGGSKQQSSSRRRPVNGGAKNNCHHLRKSEDTLGRPKPKAKPMSGFHKYSRKELEALRFVNMAQQRKFWKTIHSAFGTDVADEYHTLVSTHNHPLPHHKLSKPILSAVCCENRDSELQNEESSENVSLVDPSCSHSLIGEDAFSIVEECSEDDGSDDDYASLQRPAFVVNGEPNFDSGPPEDGWEFLRRVRWEADQCPKVTVAKYDSDKLNKNQSACMPNIPDIADCPEHLLPLKQWEDVFLAEFSALRMNFSCLDGSSAENLRNPPVHSSLLVGNDFGEFSGVMNRDVNHLRKCKANDQHTNLTAAEDKNRTVSPENPESKTSVDKSSSSSPAPPLVSAILAMDPVKRASTLQTRIKLLEAANTVTRNDCMWLFALCAAVDTPLNGNTSAALRSLLRKCASIRAGKAEVDEELVMLNILATISGRYFGQSEN